MQNWMRRVEQNKFFSKLNIVWVLLKMFQRPYLIPMDHCRLSVQFSSKTIWAALSCSFPSCRITNRNISTGRNKPNKPLAKNTIPLFVHHSSWSQGVMLIQIMNRLEGKKKKKKESEQTEPGLVWNLQRLEKSLLLTHLKKKLILSCIKTSPLACSLMSH